MLRVSVRQAVQAGIALSSLYRTIYIASHTPTQKPVRYSGTYIAVVAWALIPHVCQSTLVRALSVCSQERWIG